MRRRGRALAGPEQQRLERIIGKICLGAYEVYRRYEGDDVVLERQTVHVSDDGRRVALLERRTRGRDRGARSLSRYLLPDRLGSTSLELDDRARILGQEEFYPYGGTALRVLRRRSEAPNRYRFTGRERDDESGLDHHGARYYAPWLGRWISCDPAGLVDGTCVYEYCRSNPVAWHDPTGTQAAEPPLPGLIGNNPKVGGLWEKAVLETFGLRLEAETYKEVLIAFRSELARRIGLNGPGSNRAAGTGIHYARRMYSEARTAFGVLAAANGIDLTGIQVHHTFEELAKSPAGALDTSNLSFQGGNAGTPGSAHNFAHQVNTAHEAGIANPGQHVAGEMRAAGIEPRVPELGPSLSSHAPQVHGSHVSTPHAPRAPHAPRGKGLLLRLVVGTGVLLATGDARAAAQSLNPAASTTDALVDGGSTGAVAVGAVKDLVSLTPPGAVAMLIWDVGQPRGDNIYDQRLTDRALAEGRNPFCAQCHGPGGALDPNNSWNLQRDQKKFDSLRTFGETTPADEQAIRAYLMSPPAQ